jgi:hypothetical protein
MQFYTRLYDYIHEYQKLIYDYYSKTATAFLVTYYHINLTGTSWDSTKLIGGYYEKIGELSGVRWNKILLLPIFFIDELTVTAEATELGITRERETSIVMPSTYNINPYPNDIVKLEQAYLQPTNDIYSLYAVTNVEKSPHVTRGFYRLKLVSEQSRTTTELEPQVSNTYSFFEYTKQIYTVPNTLFLTRMTLKNELLKKRLKDLFDENSGFYFI